MNISNQYITAKKDYIKLLHFYNNIIGGAGNSTRKWTTLVHNGVLFHPEYEPHGIGVYYNGTLISLPPDAEEFITYYVNPKYDKYRNTRFNKNFFKDWKTLLPSDVQKTIVDFEQLDYQQIKSHVISSMEERKTTRENKTDAEKDTEKKEKDEMTRKYKISIVDVALAPFLHRFGLTLRYYRDVELLPADEPRLNRLRESFNAVQKLKSFTETVPEDEVIIKAYAK